ARPLPRSRPNCAMASRDFIPASIATTARERTAVRGWIRPRGLRGSGMVARSSPSDGLGMTTPSRGMRFNRRGHTQLLQANQGQLTNSPGGRQIVSVPAAGLAVAGPITVSLPTHQRFPNAAVWIRLVLTALPQIITLP